MFDEHLTQLAINALWHAGNRDWLRATGEIQDDGAFLLLSVALPTGAAEQVEPAERSAVVRALNLLMPQSDVQPGGSWMVVLTRHSKVVDSILPNEV